MANLTPPVAIVSGSGLNLRPLVDSPAGEIPFSALPGFPNTRLAGHDRSFVAGTCGSTPIILQCGRLHFYEGLPYETVTAPVDYLYAQRVRTIIFTNVAGGLLPDMNPGDLVAVSRLDTWPFVPWPARPESIPASFLVPGCGYTGVYRWMHGPNYETRAEIRVLQHLGGAVVGMSTAPEAQRCRELGIRFAVVSCVTNNCCSTEPLTHRDVVCVAQRSSERLCAHLRDFLALPRD